MRNQLLVASGMCFAATAIIFAGSARAEPPAAMTYMTQTPALIGCDTRSQVDEVIAAVKAGTMKEKLLELHATVNAQGEPVCMYGHAASVVFGESEHIGQLNDHDHTINVWVSHVGNHNTDFYLLWAEEVKTSSL